MSSRSPVWKFFLDHFPDRRRRADNADWLVVAMAASLPWSTTATAILVGCWLVALFFVLDGQKLVQELKTPAGVLPLIFCLVALCGTLWADVSWFERFAGFHYFLRLLAIPILLAQFRHSANAARVFATFLISCSVLLFASFASYLFPLLHWPWTDHGPGIPVKDYIVQSEEFALCAFALLPIALSMLSGGRRITAIWLLMLILLFLGNILYVATARTTLVIILGFMILFGAVGVSSRRYFYATFCTLAVVFAIGFGSSPYLRDRVGNVLVELQHFNSSYDPAEGVPESAALRLELWKKSIQFLAEAPLIGHGTGSVGDLFRRSSLNQKGLSAFAARNPHNQTLAVGIQLGVLGALLLYSMWLSHFRLFGLNTGLTAWIGMLVVLQNVLGSFFNSHLFDFSQAWLYILGVGVAGGTMQSERTARLSR